MKTINWKLRFRHPAFYGAVAALIGMILTDAQVIDAGKYELYVQLILGVLTTGGLVVDFTTPGIRDSQVSLEKEKPIDAENMTDDFDIYKR